MFVCRFRHIFLVLAIAGILGIRAEAQSTLTEGLIDKFNAFLPIDHSRPMTISELCCRLDCLNDALRNDGLVVLKQPDVFSQARMTRYRTDVDAQMSSDLANFHMVLAARISRLDSATLTSTTALGAALAAPGTTNVQAPQANAASILGSSNNNLFPNNVPSLFGTSTPLTSQGAFSQLGLAPNTLALPASSAAATAALGLGVDPTVYLDEKSRFLGHLNQIRRINMGPDQNDSSGYGLYLVRLPVSITPGECTYQGYGADLAVTVEHEFTPDFLPQTFQNLVINDIVDQLGPVIYEAIRSGLFENVLKPRHEAGTRQTFFKAKNAQLLDALRSVSNRSFLAATSGQGNPAGAPPPGAAGTVGATGEVPEDLIAQPLANYIVGSNQPLTGDPVKDRPIGSAIADRLTVLIDSTQKVVRVEDKDLAHFKQQIASIRRGHAIDETLKTTAVGYARAIVRMIETKNKSAQGNVQSPNVLPIDLSKIDNSQFDYSKFGPFLNGLYASALPNDVSILDDLIGLNDSARSQITRPLAGNNANLNELMTMDSGLNINLPSVRTPKQLYPIAPRELKDFFLEENIYLLAKDAQEASRVKQIRALEVRDYIRHTLETAYFAMSSQTIKGSSTIPPLADDVFMHELMDAIKERRFGHPNEGAALGLEQLYKYLVDKVEEGRENIRERPIAALCWAIAVDAAVLDAALRVDARKVFENKGLPYDQVEHVHFHYPKGVPNEPANLVFHEYIRNRWPIITFALDPVTDQQNIADSFSLNRDLQLAVSFAFATGQINFNQLNTFRRQIQQSSDTIALNRTVTGFVHNNDIFGFRFTPRFQNPPNQRTNMGVIASQLIGGGPGPDYQMRKSKLEPGLRELTAILLIPTFLPSMRMNVAGNWFKLNDPEHLVFHTSRMMERGRRVQELRQAAVHACSTQQYRETDLRVLEAKLTQLDAMLPMQSRVVQLPFDNSASGFDLFSDGATALVPELTGFSGVDVITAPAAATGSGSAAAGGSGSAAASGGGTTAAAPPATFSVTTLTTPPTTATYAIAGGTTSIADVFVFGKYFSLLDTRVIAGGRSASFEILSREVVHVQIPSNAIPTTTEDGKTYIEVYLSTPNGISNSLLIPYVPAAPAPQVAFDVLPASQSVDIYYQWLAGPDGKPALVATADPGKKGVQITWDSNTSLAPRRIQAQFVATVNGQNVVLVLQATTDTNDDYVLDGQQFALMLLNQLQGMTVFPTLPPSPIQFTVNVQPWLPGASEGVRVRTKAKQLKSKVTVNLQYNATGVNALQGITPINPAVPSAAPAGSGASSRLMPPADLDDPRIASRRGSRDPALIRTAQQLQLPSPSTSFLNAPQPPPFLNTPALLSPNVSSEAEQISKILTGQPVATTVSIPPPGSTTTAAANLSAIATPAVPQATGQVPTIVVNPSPVMLIPSAATPQKKKRKSHIREMLNKVGNRVSSAMPSQ
jgi:hypothetical protein